MRRWGDRTESCVYLRTDEGVRGKCFRWEQVLCRFFIECFKEGDVLVRIYVDVALRQCLIGGDIVGEGDDGHFEAFFFGFFGDKFHDLFRVARCRADFDFIFVFAGSADAASFLSLPQPAMKPAHANAAREMMTVFFRFIIHTSLF